MEDLRYADALRLYQKAYRAQADPALLYNQGRAHQALNNFPKALDYYLKFQNKAPPELRKKVPHLKELIAETRARVTTLVIDCDCKGARLLVRNRLLGSLPRKTPLKLTAGEALIEVRKGGFQTFRSRQQLKGDTEVHLKVKLVPSRAKGWLALSTTPTGARVILDSEPLGHTPGRWPLAPGPHRVEVLLQGYRSQTRSFVLKPGSEKELSLGLEEQATPITSRWWFWAATGVAVVAATAVAIIVLTPEEAPRGTLGSGQLNTP